MNTPASSIRPGQPWLDTQGKRIQAHGGSVMYLDGTYYWYGENKEKTDGKNGIWHWGVRCYASADLYNWEDKGLIIPPEPEDPAAPGRRSSNPGLSLEQDKELLAIYERTYGKVERSSFRPQPKPARTSLDERKYSVQTRDRGPEYLLVDGYNLIFAWEELKAVAQTNLDAARQLLMDLLSNYQGFKKCVVILVFDAYKVPRNVRDVEKYHNIYVVYTKEAETADTYIERATYEIGRHHQVRVATSDGAEQVIILGHGALRLSAASFKAEVEQVGGQIAAILARNNSRPAPARPVEAALKKAREGSK